MKKIQFKNLFHLQPKSILPDQLSALSEKSVRDWKILVSLFAVGLISISFFAWKIYLSDQLGGGYFETPLTPSEIIIKTVDKNRLQNNISVFDNRQINLSNLKNNSIVVDPSL